MREFILVAGIALVLSSIALAGCGTLQKQDAGTEEPQGSTPAEAAATQTAGDPLIETTPLSLTPRASAPPSMFLGGSLWIDAEQPGGDVLAFINDVQCGEGQQALVPDAFSPSFILIVRSNSEQAGCGVPGAEVTVMLNRRAMNERVAWQSGFREPVTLIAGPPFAVYGGVLLFDGTPPDYTVVPYINGVACGDPQSGAPIFPDNPYRYGALVLSDQMRPGCGHDGAMVSLVMHMDGLQDIVLDTVPWRTSAYMDGPYMEDPAIDLRGKVPTTPALSE